MKSKITIKELAELLDVAVSTVSKALNDSPEVSLRTKKRVKKMAALHNYRPNPAAVNLQSRRSGTIGVIIPGISDSFFAGILAGIEKEARKEGFQIITYISDESLEREQHIAWLLSAGIVDGVLIACAEETLRKKDFAHLTALEESKIPYVLYDRFHPVLRTDKIKINDQQSICEATEFFLAQGFSRIGLASSIHHLDSGRSRIRGYKQAIDNRGKYLIANSSNIKILRSKLKKLLLGEDVEAVICTDSKSTMLVYRLAYEYNIKIPEKLRLIGFLSGDLARSLAPSVSYIDSFPEKLGENAVQVLLSRIKNTATNTKHLERSIQTRLIHLESSVVRG